MVMDILLTEHGMVDTTTITHTMECIIRITDTIITMVTTTTTTVIIQDHLVVDILQQMHWVGTETIIHIVDKILVVQELLASHQKPTWQENL